MDDHYGRVKTIDLWHLVHGQPVWTRMELVYFNTISCRVTVVVLIIRWRLVAMTKSAAHLSCSVHVCVKSVFFRDFDPNFEHYLVSFLLTRSHFSNSSTKADSDNMDTSTFTRLQG